MKSVVENPWLRPLVVAFLAFSILMVTGCSGCRSKDDQETAKKEEAKKEREKKKKKKPDFETRRPVILPGVFPKPKTREKEEKDPAKAAIAELSESRSRLNRTKLGHWYTANFQAIANNFNADGELTSYAVDGAGKPVPIPKTDYFLSTSRPVALPKGEWKNFETSIYIPPRDKRVASATVSYSLNRGAGGLAQIAMSEPTALLKSFQHHIVLLSNRPDTYKFLDFADCIKMRFQKADGSFADPFYYVVPSWPGDPLPLPQHSLNWTTIAYLIWDDYDPNIIEPEHQEAILDWLHYGGQLIVSGPDCLDKLQTSFLANYLPAHFENSRNLSNADVKELNQNWTVPVARNKSQKRTFQISEKVPLLGVTFKPHDDAQYIDGTGELAIERRVGRGRIAVTAFSINAPAVRNWRSFKSFLNGALLRKPGRRFGKSLTEEIVFEWNSDGADIFEPMINSTLRYLSRDLSRNGTAEAKSSEPGNDDSFLGNQGFAYIGGTEYKPGDELRLQNSKNATKSRNLSDHWHYGGYQDAPQSGTSGWNDNSGVSLAARETLKEAAGITPPSSTFVLKMLAVYLTVLVPLNWLIFRLMGKVEYAWAAAPFIAIAGAFFVVKMAALDIGFVRSNTQIGLLEIHADYQRAHLAEYSALYTSLSSGYNADLDNLTAQSLPFGIVDGEEEFFSEESISQVQLRRTVLNRLEGFQVQSNSTGLLHTEYMLDLEGVMSFFPESSDGTPLIANGTNINLRDAAVFGRDANGDYQFCWLGDLAAESNKDLTFKKTDSLIDGWVGNPKFENTNRSSAKIWEDNVNNLKAATLEQIKEFPEIQSNWPKYERLLLQNEPDHENGGYSRQQFGKIYQVVNSSADVSLGRILDAVLQNLTLAQGEYRLVGATDQRLGRTVFQPASTQVDQQTLVVAHLKQPKLPIPQRDQNAYEDFVSRSSLDWEQDEKEAEERLKQLQNN